MRALTISFVSLVLLTSCGKDKQEGTGNAAPPRTSVKLEEATSTEGECLSVPRYLQQVFAMDPALPVAVASTQLAFESKKSIRRDFQVQVAYATFRAENAELGDLQALRGATQEKCDFITHAAGGIAETYEIRERTRDSVMAEAESGRRISLRWLSPTRLEAKLRSIAFDVPCRSEEDEIFVEETKVYEWGVTLPAVAAPDSPFAVNINYVELIADAVGQPAATAYEGDTLVMEKLREFTRLPPRPTLLTCNGTVPAPPSPDDPAEPTEPEDGAEGPENPPEAPEDGAAPPPPEL